MISGCARQSLSVLALLPQTSQATAQLMSRCSVACIGSGHHDSEASAFPCVSSASAELVPAIGTNTAAKWLRSLMKVVESQTYAQNSNGLQLGLTQRFCKLRFSPATSCGVVSPIFVLKSLNALQHQRSALGRPPAALLMQLAFVMTTIAKRFASGASKEAKSPVGR